jgi:hypothetical protein
MPIVEQNKAKRGGIGLRAYDCERTFPGFTLFAPQSGGGKIYLIDLDGEIAHTWQMPYPPGNYGYITERGALFFNGKIIEHSERYIGHQPWKGVSPWKSIGSDVFCGKCVIPIIITTAYDCKTAMSFFSAWVGCRVKSRRRSGVECLARSITAKCTLITWLK